jgi:hypothetical protein
MTKVKALGTGMLRLIDVHGNGKGFGRGSAALLIDAHGVGKSFCGGGTALSMDAQGDVKGIGVGDAGKLLGVVNTINIPNPNCKTPPSKKKCNIKSFSKRSRKPQTSSSADVLPKEVIF